MLGGVRVLSCHYCCVDAHIASQYGGGSMRTWDDASGVTANRVRDGQARKGPYMAEMRAIGRGSISSLLKFAVDFGWIGACAALGFIVIVTAASVFSAATGGAPLPGIERIMVASPRGIAMWAIDGAVVCIGAMVVFAALRGVFETLVEGDPFVAENARRLRFIALALAVIELARMGLGLVVEPLLYALGVDRSDGLSFSLNINLSAWFAVLALSVLAQVFSEGAALREEQKMTI
jgi:hypothetical protein